MVALKNILWELFGFFTFILYFILDPKEHRPKEKLRPIHVIVLLIAGISLVYLIDYLYYLDTNRWIIGETVIRGDIPDPGSWDQPIPFTPNVLQGPLTETKHWPMLVLRMTGVVAPIVLYEFIHRLKLAWREFYRD